GAAPEDPREAWTFWAHHYADAARQNKDVFARPSPDDGSPSIYYPRAATLGGCTAHNFLIAIKPHNSDWDGIAQLTGDASWRADNMQQYWTRLERNQYGPYIVS